MILFFKKNKINLSKLPQSQAGMTYVELIVVLSIFSVISSIVAFNYGAFQSRIDIKNLANDIALKVVEAQKSSLFGKFPRPDLQVGLSTTWKPSYGVYINPATDNKSFLYFVDLDQNGGIHNPTCAAYNDECLEKITITKGNYVSSIDAYYQEGNDATKVNLADIAVTYSRPSSGAIVKSTTVFNTNFLYVQIKIMTPSATYSKIKIYQSGRIQIN